MPDVDTPPSQLLTTLNSLKTNAPEFRKFLQTSFDESDWQAPDAIGTTTLGVVSPGARSMSEARATSRTTIIPSQASNAPGLATSAMFVYLAKQDPACWGATEALAASSTRLPIRVSKCPLYQYDRMKEWGWSMGYTLIDRNQCRDRYGLDIPPDGNLMVQWGYDEQSKATFTRADIRSGFSPGQRDTCFAFDLTTGRGSPELIRGLTAFEIRPYDRQVVNGPDGLGETFKTRALINSALWYPKKGHFATQLRPDGYQKSLGAPSTS